MKKIKEYLIYGFVFSTILCLGLIIWTTVQKSSINEGLKQFTVIQFILYWIGGLFMAYFDKKFGMSSKKKH